MGNGGLGLSVEERIGIELQRTILVGFTCNDADGCYNPKRFEATETGMAGTIQFLSVPPCFGYLADIPSGFDKSNFFS